MAVNATLDRCNSCSVSSAPSTRHLSVAANCRQMSALHFDDMVCNTKDCQLAPPHTSSTSLRCLTGLQRRRLRVKKCNCRERTWLSLDMSQSCS